MAFLDQLRDMAKAAAEKTEAVARTVGERAEAALEVQKLSSAVSKEQDVIANEYRKIGEYVYQNLATDEENIPEDLRENCAVIKAAFEEIDVLNKKIALIKMDKLTVNVPKIVCASCGKEVLATAKFCPECGTKIDANSNLADVEAKIEEEKQGKVVEGEVEEPAEAQPAKVEKEAANVADAEVVEEPAEKTEAKEN